MVTAAGASALTTPDGHFTLEKIFLANGNSLSVSLEGYAPIGLTIPAPAGARNLVLPDLVLAPTNGRPVVTGLTGRQEGVFLSGATLWNEYTATIDWGDRIPKEIEFQINGQWRATVPATSSNGFWSVDMAVAFPGTLPATSNQISATAVDAEGVRSEPFEREVRVIPLPAFLQPDEGGTVSFEFHPGDAPAYSFPFSIPRQTEEASASVNVPFLGRLGWQATLGAGFDYSLASGAWTAYGGSQPPGALTPLPASESLPKFFLGEHAIPLRASFQTQGVATLTQGVMVPEAAATARPDDAPQTLEVILPNEIAADQWARFLEGFAALGGDASLPPHFPVEARLRGEFPLVAGFAPEALWTPAQGTLGLGLEAAFAPARNGLLASLYLGGRIEETFVLLNSPELEVADVAGAIYGRVSLERWLFSRLDEEFVVLPPPLGGPAPEPSSRRKSLGDAPAWVVRAVQPSGQTPSKRACARWGAEQFALAGVGPQSAALSSAQRLFGSVGRSLPPAQGSGGRSPRSAPPLEGADQADLTLVSNVFPNAQPALAAAGTELMLLYVADNGMSNALQFTDLKWTRWDGTNWSEPLLLQTNTQAEFAPQVAFDGHGDALAVWERVTNPDFNETNLAAMAAQMEIVWARWDRATGTWSEPVALTANAYLDYQPQLSGPLDNGDLLLVWTRNEANLLSATNGVGANTLIWARWDSAGGAWTEPATLVPDLTGRLSQSLAAAGPRAVYAWTQDLDGVLTNAADQQVFYLEYTNGAWGPTTQLTTNDLGNRNVRVAVSPAGDFHTVWLEGTNLVTSRNGTQPFRTVRMNSGSIGFADYAWSAGPQGHLALIWQGTSPNGPGARYRMYDPISDTWGQDDLLTSEAAVEGAFAPVWDAEGNLSVAYTKRTVLHTNLTLTLAEGHQLTLSNAPQPGPVDLAVTKRALVAEVALGAGDFSVAGVNYLPGDPVRLSARVRNVGNLALSNIIVSFFDGDPNAGGALLTNVVIPGWIEAAATDRRAEVLWIVPDPAGPHTLIAALNPPEQTGELDPSNHLQIITFGGTDLAVSLLSYHTETNGALRVLARLRNLGGPAAVASLLAIRREGETGPPLATVAVPALEPGELAQVALDVPPESLSAGEVIYRLVADETGVVQDWNPGNNSAAFAVRWVGQPNGDADGDGMPDAWERLYGLNPNDPSDAGLDNDGDGLSNLAEYRAGTDPNDPASTLGLTSISLSESDGVRLVWGSVSNRFYTIERANELFPGGGSFTNLAEHLPATPPLNTWSDPSATNAPQFFYRLRLE